MNTLLDVKLTVRSIVGDDAGEWTRDNYLVPKINYDYKTQTLAIKAASGSELERIVEIPDAADPNGNSTSRGRTSCAPLQQPGQPLAGLYEPLLVWWKPKGMPDYYYRLFMERKTPQFYTLDAPSPVGLAYWSWIGGELILTPIGFPYDLLVDGRFNPPALVRNEDVLVSHPDMESCVTPATVAVIGIEAGNPGWLQAGQAQTANAVADIVAQIIRSKQGRTARAGTNAKRQMRGWFWW